jgi:hypothetical protein
VNCSGAPPNVGDALLVAQFQVDLRECGVAPFDCVESCDVAPSPAGDGNCNIGDALRIAQCDAELLPCDFQCTPFACPGASAATAAAASLHQVEQGVPGTARAQLVAPPNELLPGEASEVEVRLDVGSIPLGAYSFDFAFDPAAVEILSVVGGRTPEFSASPTCGLDNRAGAARCTAFQAGHLDSPRGVASVARLQVRMKETEQPCGMSTVRLAARAFDTSSRELPTEDAEPVRMVVGPCEGGPTPKATPAGGETVTLCHAEGGRRRATIEVSRKAMRAHMEHGDSPGPCSAP